MRRSTLLIISFSHVYRDARVLKQVNLFKDKYEVTTCSYGRAPKGVSGHIRLTEPAPRKRGVHSLIRPNVFPIARYWRTPAVITAKKQLRGFQFDSVLANDYDTVPLALSLKPRFGVHADLHEYSPGQFDPSPGRDLATSYISKVIKTYLPNAASWTTVGEGLARKYELEFGFLPTVVTNATPYAELSPRQVLRPLRLVHHGGAAPRRQLDAMIRAAKDSQADFVFDLYLQDVGGQYIDYLRRVARPDDRITVRDAVPYSKLLPLLNSYDVGVTFLPPTNFNHLNALPNKLFDYIQARVGVLSGPSPEMASVIRRYEVGCVTADFSERSLTRAIDSLRPEQVTSWKQHAHEAAFELSADLQNEGWSGALERMVAEDHG